MDSLHHAASALLGRIRIVLVSPSHGGNVGAAARAMRVMGLRRLSLVSPRFADICAHPEAIAFASGATEVLAGAQVHESLDAALADCHLAVAVSAESREFSAAPQPPWAVCPALLRALEDDEALEVAMVFGTERTGLSIEQVQRCAWVLSIPGEAEYHSLNLAQSVQVVCWELRRAMLAGSASAMPAAREPDPGRPATLAQLEGLHRHLEQALIAVEFLDPAAPKKLLSRMRRLFTRADLRAEEVDLLRGLCKQMLLAAQGRLAKGPAAPGDAGST